MSKEFFSTITRAANKVPEVTLGFWIIKVLSTTVGETGADYLAVNIGWGFGLTTLATSLLLLFSLIFQIRTKQYRPFPYWLTVVLVSIVGTQITDFLTDKLEISLYLTTSIFSIGLGFVFLIWFRSEKTLSMQSITTKRREFFYWAAILLTFALGTAAGDLATESLGLGFKVGVVVFSLMIAATSLAYRFGFSSVTSFWIAYVLTRPLGAALGDLLSQSSEYGGFGFGTICTSILFLMVIVVMVGYFTHLENKKLEFKTI